MTAAVVFAFGVDEGVAAVEGAAAPGVLARQLPRVLVLRLNGEADRGLRYFPFMGQQDGRRQFFELRQLAPTETLARLHGQAPAAALVDGLLLPGGKVRLRIHDGSGERVLFDDELDLDPRAPWPFVQRMAFELGGALGWRGAPPGMPDLPAPATRLFLRVRDELLRVEAGLPGFDPLPALRDVAELVRLAPADGDVRELLLELAARLAGQGLVPAELREVLSEGLERIGAHAGPGFLERAAAVLDACGAPAAAGEAYARLGVMRPDHPVAASRLAAARAAAGDHEGALASLVPAIEGGHATGLVLAQAAVLAERLGETERRDAWVDELRTMSDLPAAAVRVAASNLTERDRPRDALALLDRTAAPDEDRPGLELERGRALLQLGDVDGARDALVRAREGGAPAALREELERLLRLCSTDGTLHAMRELESALAGGEPARAVVLARRLVRLDPELPESWLFLGIARHKRGQRRRAERALRRALALSPDLPEAHDRLGVILLERGRDDAGREHLERAVAGRPTAPGPRLHLAQACRLLGRIDEGLAQVAEAERLGADPAMVEAIRASLRGGAA